MTAHQFPVAGKGHITFDNAGAHARGGLVGFLRVFGELQRRATVTNRKIGFGEWAFAALLQCKTCFMRLPPEFDQHITGFYALSLIRSIDR